MMVKKRVLAPDGIAEPAENDGAEWTYKESCSKCQEGSYVLSGIRQTGKEMLADDGGKRAVKIEIIPLENRPKRRCKDDFAHLGVRQRRAARRAGGG